METGEDLGFGLINILASSRYDGKVGRDKEPASQLKSDAAGCWACKKPWLISHCIQVILSLR